MSILRRLLDKRPKQPIFLGAAAALGFYAEAQLAGWVACPTELKAAPGKTEAGARDVEGLLGRFYESQEC